METKFQKRQPAYKVLLGSILNNPFVEQEGFLPNYVQVGDLQVSRVNVMGVVVAVIEGALRSVFIEDGSGKISLRSMEENPALASVDVGQMVMVIGKVREYANERYIMPEIIKPTTKEWLLLRKKECKSPEPTPQIKPQEQPKTESSKNTSENIIAIIREHDQGNGVDIETILEKTSVDQAEELIAYLIKQGEIFELRPGIVKVLE